MSSIRLRGNVAYLDFVQDGIRRRVSLGVTLDPVVRRGGHIVWPAEVLRIKREVDTQIALGIFGLKRTQQSLPLSDVLEKFLVEKATTIAPATIYVYRKVVRELTHLVGDRLVAVVSREDVARYRAQLLKAGSHNTAAKKLRHLAAILEFARRRGWATLNVAEELKLRPQEREPTTFSNVQLRDFFTSAAERDPELFNQTLFLLLTGFRTGESCQLKWDQVDLKAGEIRHVNQKAHRTQPYPIDSALGDLLKGIKHRDDGYVFHYRDVFRLYHAWEKIRDLVGLKGLTLHAFKRTYANSLYDSSEDLVAVSQLAHHASIDITRRSYLKRRALDTQRKVLEDAHDDRRALLDLVPKKLRLLK